MSEKKWKPGPWQAYGQDGVPGHCIRAQVFDADGRALASIESTDDPAVATATADLIAAAPTMAEALENLIACVEQHYGIGNHETALGIARDEARAALALATGGKDD